MRPLRVLHIADIHLGVTLGPIDPETRLNGRVLDYLDTLDATLDYAEDNKADIIIVAGDVFHKSNPDPTYLRELGERVIRMGEIAPTIIIAGNHDLPGSLEKASSVDIFDTLNVSNVIVGWQYEVHEVKTDAGLIQIASAPWPRKVDFLSYKEMRDRKTSRSLYKKRVAKQLLSLADQIDPDHPSILAGHFTVTGSVYGNEAMLAIEDVAEVDVDTINHTWDYVALGHIHLHQNITQGDDVTPVVYAGSLERIDFGDEKDNKGFVWVEIGDEVDFEFIEVDARPYVTIKVDVVGKDNPTQIVINKISKLNLEHAIVRVIIAIEQDREVRVNVSKVYRALERRLAYYVKSVSFDVTRDSVARLDLEHPISTYDSVELLSLYFGEQGVTGKERKSLMALGIEIMEEVQEER